MSEPKVENQPLFERQNLILLGPLKKRDFSLSFCRFSLKSGRVFQNFDFQQILIENIGNRDSLRGNFLFRDFGTLSESTYKFVLL